MKKSKFMLFLISLMIFSLLLSGCNKESSTTSEVTSESSTVSDVETVVNTDSILGQYTDEDLLETWDEGTSTKISLSDSGIDIEGKGATANGSILTISTGGTYVISGSLSDGQILIAAPKTVVVRLVLNGVDITNGSGDTGAPIYCSVAQKLIITLAEGSENTLKDTEDFQYADTTTEEPDATLFSKCDLTINGSGALKIESNFYNAIGTKDDLILVNGTYDIQSKNHGIRGRDSITILGGKYDIASENDGIQSNNDEDASKGWINIENGEFNITSGHDGIQSETLLNIIDGSYNIIAGDGADSVTHTVSDVGGGFGAQTNSSGSTSTDDSTSDSFKGIKSGTDMKIGKGTFIIDAEDDSIHSNSSLTILTGTFDMATGDDGIHADGTLTISDGNISITKSFEGIEGSTISIAGGVTDIVSSDDGINVAGGNDTSKEGTASSPFGQDSFNSSSSSNLLKISGGEITINAEGDGLDANGNIEMTGGTVTVIGPESDGNAALDYDGTFNITGGNIITVGGSGMAQSPSTTSSQSGIMLYFTNYQEIGSTVMVKDSSENVVFELTVPKKYSSVFVSSEDIKEGESYSFFVDGTKVTDISVTSIITSVSENGEAVQGGVGGRGGGFMDGERPVPPGGGGGGRR